MKDSPFRKSSAGVRLDSFITLTICCFLVFFQTPAQQLQTTARQHFVVIIRIYSFYSGGRESGFTTTTVIQNT